MVRPAQQLHEWREPAPLRPAATILLLRDAPTGLEVLMTRRSERASFAPGAYVFPGGALDEADHSPRARTLSRCRPDQHDEVLGSATAAIREAFEELGILLASGPDGEPVPSAAAQRSDRPTGGARLDARAGPRLVVQPLDRRPGHSASF